ncbi:hypothetical protein [Bacillus sp. AFS017336]|uniref:hypothetical protein n=1 Tax=Bacillus sp. AFS017336 TaxID=2033489 RepID=UPI000BF1ED9F|nr:hypothetical protein [Bacillus sp. AFS017336]PEL13686.1 hypothetical protein CN601_02940 [Bacillus sp. AFS017336]
MKKFHLKSKVGVTALTIGMLTFGGFNSVQAASQSAETKIQVGTTSTTTTSSKSLFFYSTTQVDDSFLSNFSDNSLYSIQSNLNNGSVQFSNKVNGPGDIININEMLEADEIAYPAQALYNNSYMQSVLKQALMNNKFVYLYGNAITISDYKSLLGLDSISVNDITSDGEEITPVFGTNSSTEKGVVRSNPERENTYYEDPSTRIIGPVNEDRYQVIGYTLNTNAPTRLITNTIVTGYNDDYYGDIPNDVQTEQILQETLEDVTQNKILEDTTTRTIVASSPTKFTLSSYIAGELVGKVVSHWTLNKKSDSDSHFDYFYVDDQTQLLTYNGGIATYLKVDHDIPYSEDYLDQWGPKDGTGSFQFSFSIPFSISFSFNMDSNAHVDDISNEDLDYARWVVTDGDMSGDTFRPRTAWKSAGTYASMDIRHWAKFKKVIDGRVLLSDEVSHKLDVNYDY